MEHGIAAVWVADVIGLFTKILWWQDMRSSIQGITTGRILSVEERGEGFTMRRNRPCPRAPRLLRLLLLFGPACLAQEKIPATEKLLFDAANQERAERKLPLLKWDEGLARAARKHAERMAEEGLLEHQLPGEHDLAIRAREAGASFSHIAENIGMAVDAYKFHDGWMQSPGHRANILDKAADAVGIAVAEGDGELYAVEDFARAVRSLSLEEQEKQVRELLASRGLHLLAIGPDARKSCELEHDYTGGSKVKYLAHYETADLSQLPEPVENKIQSRQYKSAAVGACAPKGSSGFTRFRIVVLFY